MSIIIITTMTMSIIITMIMNIITTIMNVNLLPALPAAAAANTAPRRS